MLDLVGKPGGIKIRLDDLVKLVEKSLPLGVRLGDLLMHLSVLLRVDVPQRQVLQLLHDRIHTQSLRQWGIEETCLGSDLGLLRLRHTVEGTHVVQPVGDLDEEDADVLGRGDQQATDVLQLTGGVIGLRHHLHKDLARELRQSIDDAGDRVPKHIADVLHRVLRVLHHVVQQCRRDGGAAEAHLRAGYGGDGDGVEDVGLPASPLHPLVGSTGEAEGLDDRLRVLTMIGAEVVAQQLVEGGLRHHLVVYRITLLGTHR